MTDQQPDTSRNTHETNDRTSPNERQRRLIEFAVRKSGRWDRAGFDPTVILITKPGSSRSLALYQSGTTRTGVRVAVIDPAKTGPTFITQRAAWTLLAEASL